MDFEEARVFVSENASAIDQDRSLELYGLYKVATLGICNTAKPAFYEFKNKAKWEAWFSLGNLSEKEAKERYIRIVKEIRLKTVSSNSTTGVSVSRMEIVVDQVNSEKKSIFDLAREGNLEELKRNELLATHTDENNMTVLHWAADRGHVEIIEYLLDAGFDCNLIDSEGSTPLHHAAYSGNKMSYAALVNRGARSDILNLDGETPEIIIG
jgi:acyl-CoA-binding protein